MGPQVTFLAALPNWQRVYLDKRSVLYVRTTNDQATASANRVSPKWASNRVRSFSPSWRTSTKVDFFLRTAGLIALAACPRSRSYLQDWG